MNLSSKKHIQSEFKRFISSASLMLSKNRFIEARFYYLECMALKDLSNEAVILGFEIALASMDSVLFCDLNEKYGRSASSHGSYLFLIAKYYYVFGFDEKLIELVADIMGSESDIDKCQLEFIARVCLEVGCPNLIGRLYGLQKKNGFSLSEGYEKKLIGVLVIRFCAILKNKFKL